jgi:hypothetical protein
MLPKVTIKLAYGISKFFLCYVLLMVLHFSLQPTIVVDVVIDNPDIYHILYRYVNRNLFSKPGTVIITPESTNDDKQKSGINFQSTTIPLMATVTMGSVPTGFVMNPGKWTVSLTTQEDIFVVRKSCYLTAVSLRLMKVDFMVLIGHLVRDFSSYSSKFSHKF